MGVCASRWYGAGATAMLPPLRQHGLRRHGNRGGGA